MELNRIQDIAAFVVSVKAGTYTAAAKSLGKTRSAIGKSVTRLENQLNVRLLNRSTRGLSLTDDGQALFERCQIILDDLENVNLVMDQRSQTPSGNLKITAPLAFGKRHVMPHVNQFLKRYPNVNANLSLTDRFVDVIEEGFDIAIRVGHAEEDSRIITRTIFKQLMITCASPEYISQHGNPTHPSELERFNTIFFQNNMKNRVWRYHEHGKEIQFNSPNKLIIDDTESILDAALAGFGIAHLPQYIANEALSSGQLVEILEDFKAPSEPIRLTYPSKRHLSPKIRQFIDFLVDQLAET
jgi:DNA-binding transcriptional LysR family regulator